MDINSIAASQAQSEQPEQASNSLQFETTYNFKMMSPKRFEEFKTQLDGPVPDDTFDTVQEGEGENAKLKGYRRKPVTVTLQAPEFITGLDTVAANIIKDFIASFVKSQYVDFLLPVGPHDWETICKELASSRRVTVSISDEVWEEAAASFKRYFVEVLGNETAADRLAAIMAGKFSRPSISKQASEFSENICEKLQQRVRDWAVWVAEHEESAEELADVYTFVSNRLGKHLASLKEANINLGDIL